MINNGTIVSFMGVVFSLIAIAMAYSDFIEKLGICLFIVNIIILILNLRW